MNHHAPAHVRRNKRERCDPNEVDEPGRAYSVVQMSSKARHYSVRLVDTIAEATRNPVAVHAVNPVEAGRDLARLVGLNRPGEMPFQPAIGERVHFPHGLGQIVLTEGALAVAHGITNRFNIEGLAHCEQPNGSRCAPGGGARLRDPGPDLRKVFSDVRFLACHRVCR